MLRRTRQQPARRASAIVASLLIGAATGPADTRSPLAAPSGCTGEVELIGFTDALDKRSFGGYEVSQLSGLAYDAERGVYYAIADSQPGRVPAHFFTLALTVTEAGLGQPRIRDVTVLRDSAGAPFDGTTFDGEAIVLNDRRELIIASEGGTGADQQPAIRRFDLAGAYLGELPLPARFRIGRNNESLESLALSPSGRLFTMIERPLPADGQTSDLRARLRILSYREASPGRYVPGREYFYLTDAPRAAEDVVGAVEIVAPTDDRLLVLERAYMPGHGNTIRVYRVELAGMTDVSREPSLDNPNLVPLDKTLILDLAHCPARGAQAPQNQPHPLLDNFEAMVLGPAIGRGRQVLLLVSDDNGSAAQVTRVVALSIPSQPVLQPVP